MVSDRQGRLEPTKLSGPCCTTDRGCQAAQLSGTDNGHCSAIAASYKLEATGKMTPIIIAIDGSQLCVPSWVCSEGTRASKYKRLYWSENKAYIC